MKHCDGDLIRVRTDFGKPVHLARFGREYGKVLLCSGRTVSWALYARPQESVTCKMCLARAGTS